MSIKNILALKVNRVFGIKLLLGLCAISIAWSGIAMLIDPSKRVGPFGMGIPSPMTDFLLEHDGLMIKHPKSWRVLLTPQGNHGDTEVVAFITVPSRSLPDVMIARKPLAQGNISTVARWGEARARSRFIYQPLSLTEFDTAAFPAMLREYTGIEYTLSGKAVIQCKDFYILHRQTAYTFSFCADQDDWSKVVDVFDEMINSIRVTE